MARHTPGPWEAHCGADGAGKFLALVTANVRSLGGFTVADCRTFSSCIVPERQETERQETLQANARLISAAPDLLDIGERILEMAENGEMLIPGDHFWTRIVPALVAAIKKATQGRSDADKNQEPHN